MKISARNQLAGTVTNLKKGAVTIEVTIKVAEGLEVVASVTEDSLNAMQLTEGDAVYALIKASNIMLIDAGESMLLSARNRLPATVQSVTDARISAEVLLELEGGATLSSTITKASVDALGLTEGSKVHAFFKAGSVVIGK